MPPMCCHTKKYSDQVQYACVGTVRCLTSVGLTPEEVYRSSTTIVLKFLCVRTRLFGTDRMYIAPSSDSLNMIPAFTILTAFTRTFPISVSPAAIPPIPRFVRTRRKIRCEMAPVAFRVARDGGGGRRDATVGGEGGVFWLATRQNIGVVQVATRVAPALRRSG